MTKKDVYVVVDTPKKARKLKKVLDMFGKEIDYLTDKDLKKFNAHWITQKEYNPILFFDNSENDWIGAWEYHAKKRFKVSIKELRNILAKEHLKEGDYIIATIGKTEYVVKVESIDSNEAFINAYEYLCINDGFKHNVQEYGSFRGFKRYATPEEIALLEPKQKELEVGKWYKYSYKCNNKHDGYLLFNFNGVFEEDSQIGFTHTSEGQVFVYDISIYKKEVSEYAEATPEEVESALINESKRRYKVGDKVKCLSDWNEVGNLDFKNVTYYHDDNDLWISSENYNIKVFDKGKWAEVIKTEEIKDSDIATIEALHDILLDNHKYDLNSKLLTNARELCKKLQNIKGSN